MGFDPCTVTINPHAIFLGSVVPAWVMKNRKLSPTAKLAYGRLQRYAGRDGGCFPKIATLADELGESRRSVERAIQSLRQEGLLSTERRPTHLVFHFLWHEDILLGDLKELSKLRKRLVKAGMPIETVNELLRAYGMYIPVLLKEQEAKEEDFNPKELEQALAKQNDAVSQIGDTQKAPQRGARYAKVTDPPRGCETGAIRQIGGSDTPNRRMLPFKRDIEGESLTTTASGPSPSSFSSPAFDSPGPEPKLASELGQSCKTEAEQHDEAFDRLAAAKAREAELKTRASKSKEKTETRKTMNRKNDGERISPASEGYHIPVAHKRMADKRRLQEPGYRSPVELRDVWMEEVGKVLPGVPVAPWRGTREAKLLQELTGLYSGEAVEKIFRYVLPNWPALRRRFFRGKGGPVPTLGTIVRFHASWVGESVLWDRYLEVQKEVEAWQAREKLNRLYMPRELKTRWLNAEKELKALDLDMAS